MLDWRRILSLIQLTRMALALAVISNSWLVIFLAYDIEPATGRNAVFNGMPIWLALLLGAVAAVGLHSYAFALNDVLDARHDRLFSPQRPIPAGKMRRTSAVVVAIAGLLLAILAASFLGHDALMLCLVAGAGALFFNASGKHLPAAGILALAMIRGLNMLLPNPYLGFAWPVWLMMTHVLASTALGYILEDKRPRLTVKEIWLLFFGWAAATTLMVAVMLERGTILAYGRPFIWIGPAIAGAAFVLISAIMVRRSDRPNAPRRQIGRAYMRLSILWLIVYDAAWLFCAGMIAHGLLHLALFASVYVILYMLGPLSQIIAPMPPYRLDLRKPGTPGAPGTPGTPGTSGEG